MLDDSAETSSPKRKRSAGFRFGFRLPYSLECFCACFRFSRNSFVSLAPG